MEDAPMSKPYTRSHAPMKTWRDIDQRRPLRLRIEHWLRRRFTRLHACWCILIRKQEIPFYPVRPIRRTR